MHYYKPHLHSCLFSRFRYCCTTCSINPYPSLSWRRIHSISQLTSNSTDPRPPKHRQFFFCTKSTVQQGAEKRLCPSPCICHVRSKVCVKGVHASDPVKNWGRTSRARPGCSITFSKFCTYHTDVLIHTNTQHGDVASRCMLGCLRPAWRLL